MGRTVNTRQSSSPGATLAAARDGAGRRREAGAKSSFVGMQRALAAVAAGGVLFASGLGIGVLLTEDTIVSDTLPVAVARVQQQSSASLPARPVKTATTPVVGIGNERQTPLAPRFSIGATVLANLGSDLGPADKVGRPVLVANGAGSEDRLSGAIGSDHGMAPSSFAGDRWQSVAQAPVRHRQKPMIAIVMDDLGLDVRRSNRTVALPAPLTLAYLPYARTVTSQSAQARAAGHEILLHMPMEPSGPADPGPNALLTALTETELQRRVSDALDRVPQAIGLNNHMGSRFTANALGMRVVMRELRRRGLLFLDSLTSPRSTGRLVGAELSVPTITRDIFLDDTDSRAEVRKRLEETERVARRTGTAIAIGHPRDNTLLELGPWMETVQSRGFVLVPLSQIVRARLGIEERHAAAR